MAYDPLKEIRSRPDLPVLRFGSRKRDVRLLKRALQKHHFGEPVWGNLHIAVSNRFTRKVELVVRDFQTAVQLRDDGIVGPKTWNALGQEPVARPVTSSRHGDILALISDEGKRMQYIQRGRSAVGGSRNACAATASQPLIELGIIDRTILWAQTLADLLEHTCGFTRITVKRQVKPGDLIVCADLNRNNATDHVWWALSDATGDLTAMCFDNQQGGKPHRRNLGSGTKTPMDYALRLD